MDAGRRTMSALKTSTRVYYMFPPCQSAPPRLPPRGCGLFGSFWRPGACPARAGARAAGRTGSSTHASELSGPSRHC